MRENTIKTLTLKGLSLFLYINAFNLIVVLISLYFSSIFIFNTQNKRLLILQDYTFHSIIIASLLCIASGYIIHYFYEEEFHKVKKPFRSYFQQFLTKKEYLSLYIALNLSSLLLVSFVSYKAIIFFVFYQFIMWFYAHKLSTIVVVNNLSKTIITLLPFVILSWHFQHFSQEILLFACVLFLLLWLKEIFKDLNTYKLDAILNKKTLPNFLGLKSTQILCTILFVISLFLNLYLAYNYNLGSMKWYFFISSGINIGFIILQYISSPKKFKIILFALKIWIVFGVFSIPFIDWNILELLKYQTN